MARAAIPEYRLAGPLTRPSAPAMRAHTTTVLVPTYMEAANICRLVDSLFEHLEGAEVLVIDDRSPDGTAELLRQRYRGRPDVRCVSRGEPRGFGPSMCEGMALFLQGRGDWLITLDADMSHDPAVGSRMLETTPPGGMTIGSRYRRSPRRSNRPLARHLLSVLGIRYLRAITRMPFTDTTSGFRCYSRGALQRLDLAGVRSRGYAFQAEVLYRLWTAGCPILEVDIAYRERLFGESKLGGRMLLEALWLPFRLRR